MAARRRFSQDIGHTPRYHPAMPMAHRPLAPGVGVVAVMLAALAGPLAAEAPSVSQLAWLAGCWTQARPGGVVEEHWMKPLGGTMLGMSRTVRNGKTVEFEYVQIREDGGTLVYEARPSGQPAARFPLESLEDGVAVFENPAHDFPQRIIYRRAGENGIAARIEGTMKGRQRAVDFPFTRCEP